MRISVSTDRCEGHARCAFYAPDVYVLDELGYNSMQPTEVPPSHVAQARVGAASCPEHAITVIEDERLTAEVNGDVQT